MYLMNNTYTLNIFKKHIMKKIRYIPKLSLVAIFLLALSTSLMGQTYYVKVIQPNGGEQWASGTTHLISWTDNLSKKVTILLSSDGGTNYPDTLATVKGSTYSWKIPSNLSGTDFKIRVQSSLDQSVGDDSKSTFTIKVKGSIRLLQPSKKGIEWAKGSTHLISWTDNLQGPVKIELLGYMKSSKTPCSITTIAKSVKGSTHIWKIPDNLNSTNDTYKKTLLWQDNFDGDQVNKFPANWLSSGNGHTSYVTNENSYSAPNALSMQGISGGNWEALVHREFDNSYKHYLFEFAYLFTGQGSVGLHKGTLGNFSITSGSNWATNYGRRFVHFNTDSSIICIPSNSIIGHFKAHKWVYVKVDYKELSDDSVLVKYYINNQFVHQEKDKNIAQGENTLKYFTFHSGDTRCLYDNVRVSAITDKVLRPDEYKIKVSSVNDTTISDESNNTFAITKVPKGSFVKLIQPIKKGIEWASGTKHLISWNDNLSGKVNIELDSCDANGKVKKAFVVKNNVSGSTYNWKINSSFPVWKYYKIKVYSVNDTTVFDESNNLFAITDVPGGSHIQILQPSKKGIVWAQRTTHLISWKDNLKGNVNIMLSSDGGAHYSTLKSNVKGSTWSWKVPNDLTTVSSYKIKIVSADDSTINAESNNVFTVSTVPKGSFINVLQPNKKGIKWARNTTHLISWNDNLKGNVNINLVKCNSDGTPEVSRELYRISDFGIPNRTDISSTIFDNFGNFWMGTSNGLIKFDGKNWTVYNTSNFGFPNDDVLSLAIDGFGNIWFGTVLNGLVKFDGANWTVYNTSNSGLKDNSVWALGIDKSNNIWIGQILMDGNRLKSSGLEKFDGKNWTFYQSPNNSPISMYTGTVWAFTIDAVGNMWIGTNGGKGLAKFNGQNWTVYNTSNSGLPDNFISSLAMDASGNLWIGTHLSGLVKFDGANWTVYNTSNSGLPYNTISSIAIDGPENIWIGSSKYVSAYVEGRLTKFDGIHWSTDSTIIKPPTSININSSGNIYVGYYSENSPSPSNWFLQKINDPSYEIKKDVSGSTYPWKITNQFPVYGYYKVKVSSAEDPSVFDESNNLFAITKVPDVSFITVEQPNGGEQWTKGSSHLISWNDNLSGKVNVLLSTDDGNNYSLLKSNVKGSTWTWKIPSNTTISKKCKIKVESADDNTVNDESDNPFEITKVPDGSFITIKQPNGGEQWAVGTTHLISWNDNLSGKVNIYLENGTSSYLIKSGVEGSTYSWKIDGKDHASGSSATYSTGNNFKIKVVSADDNTMYGESDNPFEIIQKLTIDAFPNPATTQVTLKFNPKDNETYQISLYNRYNKNIFTRKVNAAYMKQLHISTFDLPNGFYFLRLTSPKGVIMKKIIVQH